MTLPKGMEQVLLSTELVQVAKALKVTDIMRRKVLSVDSASDSFEARKPSEIDFDSPKLRELRVVEYPGGHFNEM